MSDERYSATDLAVIQHLFSAIPEEMGAVLGRTAYSSNIKERRDYSCALFNAQGHLLAQAAHIPVHLGAMPRSVEAVLDAFPSLQAGDVVMLNDPFCGGSHLPDVTLVSPLFLKDAANVSGYAATRAHHADVGGMTAGSLPHSTSIYQEGLRIPPVYLMRRAVLEETVMTLFCANSRNPEERKGDLRAQLQAHVLAELRWNALGCRYEAAELDRMGQALLGYGKRKMQAFLKTLPQGSWAHEEFLEAADKDHAFTRIHAVLKNDGEGVEVDFSQSDDAVSGSLNAVQAICESAVYYVILCLLADATAGELIPVNQGTFALIRCKTRSGSVVNAGLPHAVAGGNVETSQRVVDTVLGLFAQVLPDRVPAQSQGTMNNVTMGGRDGAGKSFSYYETMGGGAGAGQGVRGADGIQVHMTNTLNTPVEAFEYSYPLTVCRYALREQSGGEGAFVGGQGVVREWEMNVDTEVTLLTERRALSPAGAAGGGAGKSGCQIRRTQEGKEEKLASKGSWLFKPGDRLRIETPGGGGYGNPEE
ncbi:hydantoinase B/oxoprolinase family protein [Kiritimatiellota bacterium B12222]|nr:hydantoinase B/oxoprolinase family protein [Kiritimatiellota bacterium B12222]